MDIFDQKIIDTNQTICKNIQKFESTERGLLSQNILANLRNLVEAVSLKIYSEKFNNISDDGYKNKVNANNYVASKGNFVFLNRFHKFLQTSVGHDTFDEDGSVRLMLKYYVYLIEIKKFCKEKLNICILENINEFPTNLDNGYKEYYEAISTKIDKVFIENKTSGFDGKYYIQKVKPFFVNHKIYYEVTLSSPNDNASKFDRFIAFTNIKMLTNYSVKLTFKEVKINILNREMPIKIISNYMVSIRECEFKNLGYILNFPQKKYASTKEYFELMKYLTCEKLNLLELVDLDNEYYTEIKNSIKTAGNAQVMYIFDILDKARKIIKAKAPGYILIRYLLFKMTNRIIKAQFKSQPCFKLSNLNFDFGSIPFDKMPYAMSPKTYPAKFTDLLDSIDPSDREHEFLGLKITNNTESEGKLYTDISELTNFNNIDDLIKTYNSLLYEKHRPGSDIMHDGNLLFINNYEIDSCIIINKLLELSKEGIKGYTNSIESWLNDETCPVDHEEKKKILKVLFENSKVATIYGSAGTGKTTLISNLANFFNKKDKLFLANTHPAVENLKRRVKCSNAKFMTIKKFLKTKTCSCEILFLDECSTISNNDMQQILTKLSFSLIVIVGDIYQIESIQFGNWFNLIRYILPKASIHELTETRRTKNPDLLELWKRVRNIEPTITEYTTRKKYTAVLNEDIFNKKSEDEIILCLNYDGLYGINNINRILQNENPNKAITWGLWQYKIGDPVIFNESERFSPIIYNNMKGKIIDIKILQENDIQAIQFDIELEVGLNQMDIEGYDIELLEPINIGKSIIRFSTLKASEAQEDDDSDNSSVIPFQVAYAVSIHKSQGLEYDSVKVIITSEIEERITHSIFYTAITRSKDKLKIYWSAETENKIISSLNHVFNRKDAYIFAKKYHLQLSKIDE